MLLLISLYSSAMSGSSLSISRWLSMMLRSSLWAGPVWADTGDKWCTFSAVSSINGSIALNGRPWDERRCSQMEYIWLLKLHAKTADMCRYFLCSDEAFCVFFTVCLYKEVYIIKIYFSLLAECLHWI